MFISAQKNIRTILSAIALFRIQYSVIQFFLNPYMDKGFENPEERNWLFCNVFFIIILYYIYSYIDI